MIRRILFIGTVITAVIAFSPLSFAQGKGEEIDSALDVMEKNLDGVGLNAIPAKVNGTGTGVTAPGEVKVNIIEKIDLLDVKEVSIDNVLEMISDKTGVTFVISESQKQKVTLDIEDIDVWDLLKVLLQNYGLAYYRTDGAAYVMQDKVFRERYGYDFSSSVVTKIIPVRYVDLENLITVLNVVKSPSGKIWIDTKNRQILLMDSREKLEELKKVITAQDIPVITKSFLLKYVSFDSIREELQGLLTKDLGHIDFDSERNNITIADSEAKIKLIENFLLERDKEVVVPFRLKIVRIALHEEHLDGVDWEAIVSDYQRYAMVPTNGSNGQSETVSLGTVTQEDYDVLIDALDTVGDLAQLKSFNIDPVLDRDELMDLDTNDPFWALRPGGREGQDVPVVLDPNGFEMQMNMVVKKNGKIWQIEILPRLHWMGEGADGANYIFTGNKRFVLELNADEVAVIGGLIRTDEIARTRKFPLLGDLPMVGSVFRMERIKAKNTEYVIFLMPREEKSSETTP